MFIGEGESCLEVLIRRDSTRGKKGILLLLAMKISSRTVVRRRGKEGLLCDPGSELSTRREGDSGLRIINVTKTKKSKQKEESIVLRVAQARQGKKEVPLQEQPWPVACVAMRTQPTAADTCHDREIRDFFFFTRLVT